MHSFLDKNEQACCKQVCTSNVLRWRFTFSFLHNEHKSLACAVLVKKLIPNVLLAGSGGGEVREQGSRASYTRDGDDSNFLERLPEGETKFSLLGNFFLSEGKSGGRVLEVRCSKRREGGTNLVTAIRRALLDAFPEVSVGVGGTFLVKTGRVLIHVMPEFSRCPLTSNEDVDRWLRFYEMSTPFVCMSTCITQDPGLDLRLEHTHGYGENEGGHYHRDVTPEEVEYLGYFNLAEAIYRVDPPETTHMIGRD